MREAVWRKRPEAWTNNSWMQHHDNAPAHASLLICEFLTKHETTVVPQPPYFLDLAPADFFLFLKLKSSLKGRRFQTVQETEENSTWYLSHHPAKHVPGRIPELEKTLGAVYQEWRGVLWRRQVWLCCMWSNKLKPKKFSFFMDCPPIREA